MTDFAQKLAHGITAQQRIDARALHTHLLDHDDELGPAILELVMLRALTMALLADLQQIAGMDPEDDEWDGAVKYGRCQDIARAGIKRTTGESA